MDEIHPSDDLDAVRELALGDKAFETGAEYVVVSAVRAMAVLMTATCDLEDSDYWTVCPAYPVEGSGLDVGNLVAGKYVNLVHLPAHEHFDPMYIDLSDLRPIRRESVDFGNRLASMSREAQYLLVDRFANAMGREWGQEAGETVPGPEKYQTGKYRCANCNRYDVVVSERTFTAGEVFPVCENCRKIGKREQWYPLVKHRKS